MAIELVTEAVMAGARRSKACEVLEITLRTLQRWESTGIGDQRAGGPKRPGNALGDAERALIVAVATSQMFQDLSPAQIVPKLADAGVYIGSESSFYRILKEEKLLSRRGRAQRPGHQRPAERVATGPNEIWSWDITFLRSPVRGQFYYLYLVMDIWSRKIVGWAIHEVQNADLAAVLVREAAFREGIDPGTLVLHSDRGGPMIGATMLATLHWLGIVPSLSRPQVPDDNPYSESLFRTLKYRPEFPSQAFESLDAASQWVAGFVGWYNDEHRHSAIRFVTPTQRHTGIEMTILKQREEVYKKAKEQNQSRWSGKARNWESIKRVVLNSTNGQDKRSARQEKTA